MKKEFTTYEQALALKELGFDEPCIGWMRDWAKDVCLGKHEPSHHHESSCNAILYQQAFRWFRKKHSSHSYISKYQDNNFYHYDIFYDEVDEDGDECFVTHPCNHLYNSYEEAENACLDKLIEIVRNTKS